MESSHDAVKRTGKEVGELLTKTWDKLGEQKQLVLLQLEKTTEPHLRNELLRIVHNLEAAQEAMNASSLEILTLAKNPLTAV
jgi:hypothetical protein